MAGKGGLLASATKNIRFLFQSRLMHVTSVQSSRYDSRYLEPTFTRDGLAEPLTPEDPRHFQPIKAAEKEQNYSLNYSSLIQKFIRQIMWEGNKDRATNIVAETLKTIKLIQLSRYHRAKTDAEKSNIELDPMAVFTKAIDNCRPLLILQNVKRGGVIYQVPIPVKENYQTFTAIKWLMESAVERKDNSVRIWVKLADEMLSAYKNEGKTVRKKQELHRVCEANKAYSHFRW